ncbi:hypothetical protein EMIHUDRAFT_208142, partial [Emiliania huxleyi CCMP1516]|uniref:CSC1/OSCA1-like 7TM region domain-containing protein n=2 Tax=Emiliania huxleyi TaxID=2903 RepID=A0A0D3JBZ6_EMIH1
MLTAALLLVACEREAYFRLPTRWFSEREAALLTTALINAAIAIGCGLLFFGLRHASPTIRLRVYSPLAGSWSGASGGAEPWPPDVWIGGLRWLLWPPRWAPESRYTLELCMMIRFLSMNFRLFALFAPLAFLVLLPEGKDYIGGLEALSLNHLPPGQHTQMRKTQTHFSLRASPAAHIHWYLLTLLYLSLLRREWPVYARLRHMWDAQPAPHRYAVLLRVSPAATPPSVLEERLAALFPGERLTYPYKYSRAMMVINIGVMYACIAPLVFFILLWLVVIVPIWSYNLQY